MGKLEILKKGDILAEGISLSIGGHSTFKTYLGFIFSMAYAAVVLGVSVTQIQAYFDTSSPTVISDSYSTKNYPAIDLRANNLNPVVVAWSTEVDIIEAEDIDKYFTLKAQKIIWGFATASDGSSIQTKNFEDIPMVACKSLSEDHKKSYDYMKTSSFYDIMMGNGICIDFPANFTVQGNGADDLYSLFTLKLMPCSLESGCKSADEMAKVNFVVGMPITGYNASNYHDPLNIALNIDEVYYVHPLLKQAYLSKIRQNRVTDYVGLFPDWKQRTSLWEVGGLTQVTQYRSNVIKCTKAQVSINDNPACLSYFEYSVQSSGMVTVNKRIYQSLSETLGNIGGSTQVIFVLLMLIYRPINDHMRRKSIVEKILPLIFDQKLGELFDQGDAESDTESKENKVSPSLKSEKKNDRLIRSPDDSSTGINQSIKTLQNRGLLRCCQKKKNREEVLADKRLEDAYNKIESNLDLISIIKDSNTLATIDHVLLKDRHRKLTQYLGFKFWRKQRTADKRAKHSPCAEVEEERARVLNSIETIREKQTESGSNFEQAEQQLAAMLDTYFAKEVVKPGIDLVPDKQQKLGSGFKVRRSVLQNEAELQKFVEKPKDKIDEWVGLAQISKEP